MNNDYLDYLAHARTKGSKNGVSHTPGYTAVGKPAMSDDEKKAKNARERTKIYEMGSNAFANAVDMLWKPKKDKGNEHIYKLPTKKIESINRRERAIDEYNRNHPSKGEKAKKRTMDVLKGIGQFAIGAATVTILASQAIKAMDDMVDISGIKIVNI